jgi:hypothetical protein
MILCFGMLTSQLLQSKWEKLINMFYMIIYSFISYGASRYVMSPPIREAGHGKALQDALSSGILQVKHLILYSVRWSHMLLHFAFPPSICIKWYISHQETIITLGPLASPTIKPR